MSLRYDEGMARAERQDIYDMDELEANERKETLFRPRNAMTLSVSYKR